MNIRDYLPLLLVVLYISDDTVVFGTNVNQVFVIAKYVIYLALVAWFLVGSKLEWERFNSRNLVMFFVLLASFSATMLLNLDFRNGYLLELIVIVLAVMIAKRIALADFLQSYSCLLFWLTSFSLFIFAASLLARPLIDVFPVIVNYGGTEFTNLVFAVVFRDTEVMRNTGIFREPGVFALYLLVGIIVELFYFPAANKWRLSIFLTGLTTTVSTTGIIIVGVLFTAFFVRARNVKALVLLVFAMVAALGAFIYFPELTEKLLSKFDEESSDFVSALARLSSFTVPFMIFADNPVAGVGLTRFVDLYLMYSEQLFGFPINPDSFSTNTIINAFAIFGVTFGMMLTLGLYRIAKMLGGAGIAGLMIFAGLFMMYSSQELRFSLFFNVLIMYGLFGLNRKIKEEA